MVSVKVLFCLLVCAPVSWCYNASDNSGETTPQPEESIVKKLQEFFASAMDKVSPDLTRKLLTAEVSPTCSIGLLKLVGAIRRVEPWALRLIDSMGKYPTGLMQASKADLGAFDECVETVVHDNFGEETVRAQYCNLDMRIGQGSSFVETTLNAMRIAFPKLVKFKDHITDPRLPPIRLGICVTNDCNEEELQELLNQVLPPGFDVKISNCVTSLPVPLTEGQKAIFIALGVLAALVVFGTVTDICVNSRTKRNVACGILVRLLTGFSLISNTKTLLQTVKDKSSDAYTLRFFHGLRFFSLVWIVLGHCYGALSPTWSRLLNNLLMAENIQSLIVPAAYAAVDTFFFLSAYLMCYAISKQKKPAVIVFVFAVIRRFIRTMVPVFFVLMCMYLLPVMTSGPDAKSFFDRFYGEMDRLWLDILLQIQNYRKGAFVLSFQMIESYFSQGGSYKEFNIRSRLKIWRRDFLAANQQSLTRRSVAIVQTLLLTYATSSVCYITTNPKAVQNVVSGILTTILVHLWYLSVDFQLFLVSLPIVMIVKNRRRWAIAVFVVLSLVSCALSAWQITGTEVTPFVLVVTESMSILEDTLNNYYLLPFYHAVCYFSGCIAFFLLQEFRDVKVPKIAQAVAWIGAAGCGACCIFAKYPWYMERHPTSDFGNMCMAFFDRIMWSLLLLWITLTCATGRGGYLNSFLSWNAFVPLSRLTFAVYLIHAPFILLVLHISRERILYSHFTLVSMCFSILMWSFCLAYLAFIFCEAPTAQLDKLIFMGGGRRDRQKTPATQNGTQNNEKPWVVTTEMVEKSQPPMDLENGNNIPHNVVGNNVTYHL